MPSLAFRKASICSRFSFSASCTLVVNPQHATRSRLILCWKLPPPSGSSCIGKDYGDAAQCEDVIIFAEPIAVGTHQGGCDMIEPAANDLLRLTLELRARHPTSRQWHQGFPVGLAFQFK